MYPVRRFEGYTEKCNHCTELFTQAVYNEKGKIVAVLSDCTHNSCVKDKIPIFTPHHKKEEIIVSTVDMVHKEGQ